eukprot:148674-Prymnesium_polylepis.1
MSVARRSAFFLGGGDGVGEGRERSGGGVPGGRRPSLAAMAAEELALATRRWRWRWWSGAA